MRVKECLWLTGFICISVIALVTIFGFGPSRAKSDSMGSKVSSSKSVSTESSVGEHIQQLIHQYTVMVFSKSYCPYSRKAKSILSKYNLGENYHVMELDQLPSKADEYQNELGKLTGARTVPRVFIGGKFIGGGDDTEALDQSGDLKKLLKEAKALVD